MAKKTIFVSDKSAMSIPDGQGAKVRITFNDARKGVREADVTTEEGEQAAQELGAVQVARRGRKPATA